MGIKYQNISKIGFGGFADVWKCKRSTDKKVFAKKLLISTDTNIQKRFRREVRILNMLDHPNIVKVIGKRLEREPYFYVMPLYSTTLRNEISSLNGDDERIFIIFSAVLDALEYAHQQGVIHRDLKPENILMNNDHDVVVSDFGLGRILDSTSSRKTNTGDTLGTYLYMPPEQQSNSKDADELSDIYSLGIILCELYTGSLSIVIQDVATIPAGVALIIKRCTQADPNKRFQSITDLKSVWHDLFDISKKDTEMDELLLLRADLTAGQSANEESIERFLELLIKYQKDSDLVHDTFMQVDSSVIAAMYEENREVMGHLLKGFIEDLKSQDWLFDYTDKIGNKCSSLYKLIEDDEIRALLIDCVLKVGANHNRWHVLRIFGRLISLPKDRDELVVLAELLKNTEKWIRKNGVEYIEINKIDSTLRKYFEFDDEAEEDSEPEF